MALLPSAGVMDNKETLLLILTNPGQLHVYDKSCLSGLTSQLKNTSVPSTKYTMVVPTIEPNMTVSKFSLVLRDGEVSRALSKTSAEKLSGAHLPKGGTEWPLTGGIPSQFFNAQNYQVERVYISGYQDGSVRIWDATYPALSLIHTIGPEVKGVTSEIAAVTALDFCSSTHKLSIGDECGAVRIYDLIRSSFEKPLHFVTRTGNEVQYLQQGNEPQCLAVFFVLSSPICTLHFANSGSRLAVGFNCGQVAMFDIDRISVLFLTDVASETSSPVTSLSVRLFLDANNLTQSPTESQPKIMKDSEREVLFTMTRNAHISVRDSTTGNLVSLKPLHPEKDSTAISMYIIEDGDLRSEVRIKNSLKLPEISESTNEQHSQANAHRSTQLEVGLDSSGPSLRSGHFGQRLMNLLILLCCEDALYLYSLNSVTEGESDSILKVDLVKPCCWTTILKKDEKECGLVVLYQTGVIEIRSLPNLEVLGESSIMSILRWNFKAKMDKTICYADHGQIALVNGGELAFISLLTYENDFRIPDSLPCLHDKVLAAAVDATVGSSSSQKQASIPGTFGGNVKGLKAEKVEQNADLTEVPQNIYAHLESLFSSPPFLKPSTAVKDDQEILELNLDDIVIDEPRHVSSSSPKNKNAKKDKGTERDRLFEGATSDSKPKLRTAEEIRAKYRKNEDAAGAAAQARDKLVQRQEKLERLGQHTEELKDGAENFAAMAKELAKSMENRKWWHI
ncbi:WD repeat containing protein [Trema orientale]|uniref:WD repeat containing protein n=1 Tax=Trema orientale TaxID=63057 RepID=A0A2P5ELZ0_TREOI|nr:WD repeat containing protein [Trema orientale]